MDDKMTSATGLLAQSITDLDLESLPERLDDDQLTMVRKIATAPLPCLPPVTERHLAQCLRVMLAVLPRQQSDDLAGELFVAAYYRQLGHMPTDQISYLADQATKQCRWFPTIAECLEIASGWRRCDADTLRQSKAWGRYHRERSLREAPPVDAWTPEPGELDRIKAEIAAKFRSNRT